MNLKNFFEEKLKETEREIKVKENKEKILNFIENNSSKGDFIHWLINNTKGSVFSEEDSWESIKEKIIENPSISYSLLRSYAVNLKGEKIVEEAIEKLIKESQQTQEIFRKVSFLGGFKKFSILIGGGLIFLGILEIISAVVLILENTFFSFLSINLRLALVAFLVVAGIFNFLGGIFLSVM